MPEEKSQQRYISAGFSHNRRHFRWPQKQGVLPEIGASGGVVKKWVVEVKCLRSLRDPFSPIYRIAVCASAIVAGAIRSEHTSRLLKKWTQFRRRHPRRPRAWAARHRSTCGDLNREAFCIRQSRLMTDLSCDPVWLSRVIIFKNTAKFCNGEDASIEHLALGHFVAAEDEDFLRSSICSCLITESAAESNSI